ncbi:hypothetical protein D0469_07860 [Peribacillus saganii]|uniref:Uncharacterized protein n=1 Tax=Peribacillus saganii TaxID=2303992 RepID=A0A372LPP5_9BACI|nr:hypothetical protein D0469_07860 [Peribacillus saganii]
MFGMTQYLPTLINGKAVLKLIVDFGTLLMSSCSAQPLEVISQSLRKAKYAFCQRLSYAFQG